MMSNTGLCPCTSGLAFTDCCGVSGRTAANAPVFARLSSEGAASEARAGDNTRVTVSGLDQSPDLLPVNLNFDSANVRMVQMSPRWYTESLFLDPERVKGTCVVESSSDHFLGACGNIKRRPLSVIFHSAFCGSTLLTKALEETYDCLALREPAALTQLYEYLSTSDSSVEEKERWRDSILKVMSRSYDPTQRALLKTSDKANRLVWELQKEPNDTPMLFMYVPLRDFLVSCVRADNRKVWVRDRCSAIQDQLAGLLNVPDDFVIHDDDVGTQAALYWSFNLAVYLKAYRQNSESVSCLDFNAMLADPVATVQASGRHLQLEPLSGKSLHACLVRLLGRYSKVPELDFSPQLRTELIDLVAADHKAQLVTAQAQAKAFLGDDYPVDFMPGHLV